MRSGTIANMGGVDPAGISGHLGWKDLLPGAYEIHFEATGQGRVIKKVVVAPNAGVSVSIDSMTKNDQVWGAGPTLFDLQKRIEVLEKQNKTP